MKNEGSVQRTERRFRRKPKEPTINLWSSDGSDLIIDKLPGGAKIGIEEHGIGRAKSYCAYIRWPMRNSVVYQEYIGRRGSYEHAKAQAERYVHSNFHIWVLGLEGGLRPPQLGIDIKHPEHAEEE